MSDSRGKHEVTMRITGAVLQECGRPRPFAGSRPMAVTDVELDDPGPGEILVQMEAAGVCHSDLSVVNGNRLRPVPMVLGHEASGRVLRCGPGVEGIEEGGRVAMVFMPRCGQCAECRTPGMICPEGNASNTAGTLPSGAVRLSAGGTGVRHHCGVAGFATHTVVDRRSVVPIPDDVPAEVAALFGCAVLTGGGAVRNRAGLHEGEEVFVVGAGGVGLAAALVARACEAGRITVVDPVEAKRATALEVVADAAVSPEELLDSGERAPLVIESAGNASGFETAVQVTAPGGRMVSVGLASPEARASISPLSVVGEAKSILGSYLGSGVPEDDIRAYVELWRSGALPIERLISARIGLEEINEAMDALSDGRAMRQIITF
jgi:alcohol dehydrogenase